MKKKTIFSSLLTIVLCLSLIAGSTYALFTSEDEVNISVTSGKVDLNASITNIQTWSLEDDKTVAGRDGAFTTGGSAKLEADGSFTIALMTPGDKVSFDIVGENLSNVLTQYRYIIECVGDNTLMEALEVTIDGILYKELVSYTSAWDNLAALTAMPTVTVTIEMPKEVGDDYQDLETNFKVTVEAVQGNAGKTEGEIVKFLPDKWNGEADISWYNETDTEFTLTSAEAFAGFAELVSEDADNFAGKTIKLDTDIDLNRKSFAPIGTTGERDSQNRLITEPFKGTFDGNGNTIANLSQSGWDFGYEWGKYGSIGLFSELESATVKNVVLEGFDCAIEGGDISFIAGSATGDCTFENIEIKSGSIGTYNNGIGGIIGWSGAGTYNFKNITLGEDVVIGGLWGSFDSSAGGIVGQAEPGATYNFENVNVACRMDVFNDCTASYDYYNYRMCGMLIGRLEETTTIDGVNYPDTSKYNITCTNVTVTYGEWANYHYCEPTPANMNGGRGMRVEPGYAYDGLPADYDHSQCVDNCMNLIPFDQIFGGDQLGVKGLKTYDGVTVIYNNKNN